MQLIQDNLSLAVWTLAHPRAVLCFRPSLTCTAVPRAACLHQPTSLSQKTNWLLCPHACLSLLSSFLPYRPKVWSGNVRRITKRGSPSFSPISKSITCPISFPTSQKRPVCTILFWVSLYGKSSLFQSFKILIRHLV